MEAVIFIGIQATGKSIFYKDRFFKTHIRINLDMLRTMNREALFIGRKFSKGFVNHFCTRLTHEFP